MRVIEITDQDTQALDALNGAEILRLRRFQHVYDRVIREQQVEIEQLAAERDALKAQLTSEPPPNVTALVPDPPSDTVAALREQRNGQAPLKANVGGDG